jgi:hypothetical protein
VHIVAAEGSRACLGLMGVIIRMMGGDVYPYF